MTNYILVILLIDDEILFVNIILNDNDNKLNHNWIEIEIIKLILII